MPQPQNNETKPQPHSVPPPQKPRREYKTPKLTVLGTVQELTKALSTPGSGDLFNRSIL